jgi:hypothetical protein
MALCEKNLGMFIQSVRSLQTAADLDIKMPVMIVNNRQINVLDFKNFQGTL